MMTTTAPAISRKRRIGFDKINRRTHLYAGLFFIPWFCQRQTKIPHFAN
jgi:hypothetical protein